jgi:hypothetical protein
MECSDSAWFGALAMSTVIVSAGEAIQNICAVGKTELLRRSAPRNGGLGE